MLLNAPIMLKVAPYNAQGIGITLVKSLYFDTVAILRTSSCVALYLEFNPHVLLTHNNIVHSGSKVIAVLVMYTSHVLDSELLLVALLSQVATLCHSVTTKNNCLF